MTDWLIWEIVRIFYQFTGILFIFFKSSSSKTSLLKWIQTVEFDASESKALELRGMVSSSYDIRQLDEVILDKIIIRLITYQHRGLDDCSAKWDCINVTLDLTWVCLLSFPSSDRFFEPQEGRSALWWACRNAQRDLVHVLLDCGPAEFVDKKDEVRISSSLTLIRGVVLRIALWTFKKKFLLCAEWMYPAACPLYEQGNPK